MNECGLWSYNFRKPNAERHPLYLDFCKNDSAGLLPRDGEQHRTNLVLSELQFWELRLATAVKETMQKENRKHALQRSDKRLSGEGIER
jgi:hypothetical protein